VAQRGDFDRVVAAIDQRVVTTGDLDFWILEARLSDPTLWEVPDEELRPAFVTRVIDEILLADWAQVQVEEIPPALLRERIRSWNDSLRDAAGGVTRLADHMADSGLEPDDLVKWVEERARRKILVEQAILGRVSVGAEDAMEGMATDAIALRVAHIVIRVGSDPEGAWKRALEIRRDIATGLPFAQAARLHSEDTFTNRQGGDLGWLTHDELALPLWDAAAALRRGDVSLPVRWQSSFHILQLIDFETERQRAFFEALRREEMARLKEQREIRRIRLAPGYILEPLPPLTP
jgi:hypothetical protein